MTAAPDCAQWWQPLITQGVLAWVALLFAVSRWIDRRNGSGSPPAPPPPPTQ